MFAVVCRMCVRIVCSFCNSRLQRMACAALAHSCDFFGTVCDLRFQLRTVAVWAELPCKTFTVHKCVAKLEGWDLGAEEGTSVLLDVSL